MTAENRTKKNAKRLPEKAGVDVDVISLSYAAKPRERSMHPSHRINTDFNYDLLSLAFAVVPWL